MTHGKRHKSSIFLEFEVCRFACQLDAELEKDQKICFPTFDFVWFCDICHLTKLFH